MLEPKHFLYGKQLINSPKYAKAIITGKQKKKDVFLTLSCF